MTFDNFPAGPQVIDLCGFCVTPLALAITVLCLLRLEGLSFFCGPVPRAGLGLLVAGSATFYTGLGLGSRVVLRPGMEIYEL